MRVLVVLAAVLFTLASGVACKRYITLSVDVSASVLAPVQGVPSQVQMKESIKGALRDYLFRDKQSCLAVYTFATNGQRVSDFVSVATTEGQATLLGVIDNIVFETSYPRYYTNWEAGLDIVLQTEANASVKSSWLYLVTDGYPTTRSTDCLDDDDASQPCDGYADNLRAAVNVAKQLISVGTGVVGVGIGEGVTDAALVAISGPCQSCTKGWNYFHIDTFKRLELPLGESFGQRLALGPDPSATTTPTMTTTTTELETTTTEEPTTTTTTTTTTKRRTTKPRPRPTTTTTTKKKLVAAQTRSPRRTLGPTDVHTDAQTPAIIIGIVAGGCLFLVFAIACVISRHAPYPAHVIRAEQEEQDDVGAGYRIDTPMLMQSSFHGGGGGGPRLIPQDKRKVK